MDSCGTSGRNLVRLPNADRALVDIAKLRSYCLNSHHPEGRHKARVFMAALDLGSADAEELRDALLAAARTREAVAGEADEYGRRFWVDFTMHRGDREANVRSSWIIRRGEDCPRLTSCYVL